MIINENSPLVRMPSDLNIKYRILLDGIRYSASIVDISYQRIVENLRLISQGELHVTNPQTASLVFSDAWAMVDAANRLRKAIIFFCGIKWENKGEIIDNIFEASKISLIDFVENTHRANSLRNFAHHSLDDKEMNYLVRNNKSIWGRIDWFYTPKDEPGRCSSFSFAAGSEAIVSVSVPLGVSVIRPLGPVSIAAYKYELCLSKLQRLVLLVVEEIEGQLRPQLDGEEFGPADVMCQLRLDNIKFTESS